MAVQVVQQQRTSVSNWVIEIAACCTSNMTLHLLMLTVFWDSVVCVLLHKRLFLRAHRAPMRMPRLLIEMLLLIDFQTVEIGRLLSGSGAW